MTDSLEGDNYVTLNIVWISFLDIIDILKESEEDQLNELEGTISIVNEMKKIGRKYCATSTNVVDMTPSFLHKAMTFLTPHFKRLDFIAPRDKYDLYAKIQEYLDVHYPKNELNENVLTADQNIQNNNTANAYRSSKFGLKIFMMKFSI